jgi:hypothetical protein
MFGLSVRLSEGVAAIVETVELPTARTFGHLYLQKLILGDTRFDTYYGITI